jgi:N utilization substance protein A
MKVDPVGACVGVRGSRIRNIVDELGGEKIDIVRWNESSQVLISNALKPAEVKETFLCFELGRATVVVDEEQLSLAIGKRGQNVRLAARLTGWDIDILTPADYDRNMDGMERVLKSIEGVDDVLLDKLLAMGVIAVADVKEVGTEPLVNELAIEVTLAQRMVAAAEGAADALAAEAAEAKKAEQEARDARRLELAGGTPASTQSQADQDPSQEVVTADGEGTESLATASLESQAEDSATEAPPSSDDGTELAEPVIDGVTTQDEPTGLNEEKVAQSPE